MTAPNAATAGDVPLVRIWLWLIALLIFAMVIIGGATRLTDSGLSITEWQPILGVIPPLNEADWQAAFEKYQQIPEYSVVHPDMTLESFKSIYWWEWTHRLLGRLIGVAFFVPFLFFWVTGRLNRRLLLRLGVIFVLGGLQGALGWYMVKSGLADRTDVSQYRLAAHLVLATIIFGAVVWSALGLGRGRTNSLDPGALGLVLLVLLQIGAGALVAGLDAGQGYNTWPLMDGSFVPTGLVAIEPAWRNLFESALTVQFDHRVIAYIIVLYALVLAWLRRAGPALVALAAILLQVSVGVWTLLSHAALPQALLHQAGAMLVFATALWNLHCSMAEPRRERSVRFAT
jgi:cytochrome c oxidase assembly protein subunit 15